MKVKTKKRRYGRVIRVEGEGDIKEVLIHSDVLKEKENKVSICFRGRESSGIVELDYEEAEDLYGTLGKQLGLIKGSKVKVFKDK